MASAATTAPPPSSAIFSNVGWFGGTRGAYSLASWYINAREDNNQRVSALIDRLKAPTTLRETDPHHGVRIQTIKRDIASDEFRQFVISVDIPEAEAQLFGPYMNLAPHAESLTGRLENAALLLPPQLLLIPTEQVVRRNATPALFLGEIVPNATTPWHVDRNLHPHSLHAPRHVAILRRSRVGVTRWMFHASPPPFAGNDALSPPLAQDYFAAFSGLSVDPRYVWCVEVHWTLDRFWQARLVLRGVYDTYQTPLPKLIWMPPPTHCQTYVWHPLLWLGLCRAQPWPDAIYPIATYGEVVLIGEPRVSSGFVDGEFDGRRALQDVQAQLKQHDDEIAALLVQLAPMHVTNDDEDKVAALALQRESEDIDMTIRRSLETWRQVNKDAARLALLLQSVDRSEREQIEGLLHFQRDLDERVLELLQLSSVLHQSDDTQLGEDLADTVDAALDAFHAQRELFLHHLGDLLADKSLEAANLQKATATQQLKIDLLMKNRAETTEALKKATASIEAFIELNGANERQKADLQHRIDDANVALAESKKNERTLTEVMDAATRQVDALRVQAAESAATLESTKQELDVYTARLAALASVSQAERLAHIEEVTRLRGRQVELETRVARLAEETGALEGALILASRKAQRAIDDKTLAQDKINTLEESAARLRGQVRRQTEVVEATTEDRRRLQEEIEILGQELETRIDQHNQTRDELRAATRERTAVRAQLSALETDRDQHTLTITQLEEELKEATAARDFQIDKHNQSARIVHRLMEEAREMYTQMVEREAELNVLRRTKLALETEVAECRQRIRHLHTQLGQLSHEKTALILRLNHIREEYAKWAERARQPIALRMALVAATRPSLHYPVFARTQSAELTLRRDSSASQPFIRFIRARPEDVDVLGNDAWSEEARAAYLAKTVLFNPARLALTVHQFAAQGLPVFVRYHNQPWQWHDDAGLSPTATLISPFTQFDDSTRLDLFGRQHVAWRLDEEHKTMPAVVMWSREGAVTPEHHFYTTNRHGALVSSMHVPRRGFVDISDGQPYGTGGVVVYAAKRAHLHSVTHATGFLPSARVDMYLQQMDDTGDSYQLLHFSMEPLGNGEDA